ncbi:hypothetical protein FOZ63_002638, partial [Perkinsus olseni]
MTEVLVGVDYRGLRVYDWTPETLENRVYLMRDLFEAWCDEGQAYIDDLHDEDDPFWDPITLEREIGTARIYLESLTMQLENELDAKVMSSSTGRPVGTLTCAVWPLSRDGSSTTVPDEEIVEEPSQLVGLPLSFRLVVKKAAHLTPRELANNVRVRYRWQLDDEDTEVSTKVVDDDAFMFDYERDIHLAPCLTQRMLSVLLEEAIALQVYGESTAAKEAERLREEERRLRDERAAGRKDDGRGAATVSNDDMNLPGEMGRDDEDGEEDRRSSGKEKIAPPSSPEEAATTSQVDVESETVGGPEAAAPPPTGPRTLALSCGGGYFWARAFVTAQFALPVRFISIHNESLYKKGQLTDCILAMPRVGGREEEGDEEEEEEEVKLHKLILASYSRYCYRKIIPPEDDDEEEGGDAVVVPQEGGVLRIEIPTLLDPHATRSDIIKCIGVITSFMYKHGDWDTAILQNPELMAPSSSSLVQQQQAQCGLLLTLLGLSLTLDV